jgi:histidyl-tRNA synthetase
MFQVMKRGADLARSLERGGGQGLADLAMRFDLTVPLARYFASHRSELPAVFKRYQIGPVWRAERPQYGRFREFTQCDIDVLGSTSPMVEAEVITASAAVFHALGFDRLTFRLNSRPLLDLLVQSFGVPTTHTQAAFVAIDKLDKLAGDDVHAELLDKGISADSARAMLEFHAQTRPGGTSLDSAALLDVIFARVGPPAAPLIDQLRNVLKMTPALPAGDLCFDPFLARGMDYYTGPVFEVIKAGVPFSIAGGGRFDQLIERLGGPSVPACGFSIGFERIYTLMEDGKMFSGAARAADALIAVPRPEECAYALSLGSELRGAGLAIDVFPGSPKLVAQYELAEQKRIPYVVVADSTQLPSGARELPVRTIATRTSVKIPEGDVANWLKNALSGT